MKNRHLVIICPLLMTIVLFGFGCKSIQSNSRDSQPMESDKQLTKVTKDNLKARLGGKNVQFIEKISDEKKPNSLLLVIKIVEGGAGGHFPPKIKLNGDDYELSTLVPKLRSVFKAREENGVFQEGTNVIDKKVTLAASETDIEFYNKEKIYVEDFERLIDDLHKEGIDQIEVNFAELPTLKVGDKITPIPPSTRPKLNLSTPEEPPPPKKSTPN